MIVVYWSLGYWKADAIEYKGVTDFFGSYHCSECIWLVPETWSEEE